MRTTIAIGCAIAALLLSVPVRAAEDQKPARPSQGDTFSPRAWTLNLDTHGALETWNYNLSHEEMLGVSAGITYGIGKGVALKAGAALYRVWQRRTDGYLFGATWGVRSRIIGRRRWSAFWEFEVGVSESDTFVPPGGTRFNYLALGGGGITVRLRPGLHGVAGLRWVHVSNNGLAGRSRNPDIEAVGPVLGVMLPF